MEVTAEMIDLARRLGLYMLPLTVSRPGWWIPEHNALVMGVCKRDRTVVIVVLNHGLVAVPWRRFHQAQKKRKAQI